MSVTAKELLRAVPFLAAPLGLALAGARRRLVRHFTRAGATSPGTAIDSVPKRPFVGWWVKRLQDANVLRLTNDGRRWVELNSYADYQRARRKRGFTVVTSVLVLAAAAWLVDQSGLSPELKRALAKLAVPSAAMALVLLVSRVRGFSLRDDFALRPPTVAALTLWVGAHVGYMLLTNAVMQWRGPWDFTIWEQQGVAVGMLRVLAVCFAGPLVEEMIFRGILFHRLRATRLGPMLSVVVLAAVWAGIHVEVGPEIVALFFGAGLLLGAARWKSGSLYVPIAMHIAWNLYAVW